MRFDAAVQRLDDAGAGDDPPDVIVAYDAVAEAAQALAGALQAVGE